MTRVLSGPRTRRNRRLSTLAAIAAVVALLAASGCSLFGKAADEFEFAFKGKSGTITTYNENGQQLDEVHGRSISISRDTKFDAQNGDGTSKNDSSVLLITVGNSQMHHVGSSLILAEDGIVNVSDQLPATVKLDSNERGVPVLNRLFRSYTDLWHGKAQTILVRSQNGTPIAIFAGNSVNMEATEVPKSTWLRIDGLSVVIYRSDYTIYDNRLLQQSS